MHATLFELPPVSAAIASEASSKLLTADNLLAGERESFHWSGTRTISTGIGSRTIDRFLAELR